MDPLDALRAQTTQNANRISALTARVVKLEEAQTELEIIKARIRLIEQLLTEIKSEITRDLSRLPIPLRRDPTDGEVWREEVATGMRG